MAAPLEIQNLTFFDESAIEVQLTPRARMLRAFEQLNDVYESEREQVRQYCARRIKFPIF